MSEIIFKDGGTFSFLLGIRKKKKKTNCSFLIFVFL